MESTRDGTGRQNEAGRKLAFSKDGRFLGLADGVLFGAAPVPRFPDDAYEMEAHTDSDGGGQTRTTPADETQTG